MFDTLAFLGPLTIGPFTIHFLWLFISIGMLFGLLVIAKLYKLRPVKMSFLANKSFKIFLITLFCSRIFFIFRHFNQFFENFQIADLLKIFTIWDKGLSLWGGIMGLFIALYFFAKSEKEYFTAWTDLITPALITGLIFGNLGTFLEGKNYGLPAEELPWAIINENSQFAVPIHPTQLYAMILNLIIFIILFTLFNRKPFQQNGRITTLGILLYSSFRFLEEFFRGDESNYFLNLREAQIYCIIAFFLSLYFLVKPKFSQTPKPKTET